MIRLIDLTVIIVLHWFAEFILQGITQRKNKVNNVLEGVVQSLQYSYFISFGIFLLVFISNPNEGGRTASILTLWFSIVTLLSNFLINFILNKQEEYYYNRAKQKQYLLTFGGRQMIHILTLCIIFKLTFNYFYV